MTNRQVPIVTATRHHEVTSRLAGVDGLFVGLDFDGTLAPIADDPDEPTATPACRRALETFVASPDATVAVISGRALSDLQERVGIDGVAYAGNHGLELRRDGHRRVHPVAERRRPAVRRTIERISNRLAGVPNWKIEDKGLTATVHVRQTPPEQVDEVRAVVETMVRQFGDGLWMASGKEVFEIRPAVDWDKGAAITHLSEDAPDGWSTVYLGDDVTDEDAFSAVRPDGIGILVGAREGTNASYRLPAQDAVAPFLDRLADEVLARSA